MDSSSPSPSSSLIFFPWKWPTMDKKTDDEKTRIYTLKSWDNESFEVDESVAMMFWEVRQFIKRGWTNTTIPLSQISGSILSKIIDYCLKHNNVVVVDSKKAATDDDSGVTVGGIDDDLKEWDEAFIDVDQATLFKIIVAASTQGIGGLLDLAFAKLVCGRSN